LATSRISGRRYCFKAPRHFDVKHNPRPTRCCIRRVAGVLADNLDTLAEDDDQERSGRLPLPGKGAVRAHRSTRLLTAESDDDQQS
jgi:hypothetical protein